ncbi:glycine betaine ABC transporter substrate-binding protein, partial [Lactiplantibacillus pentosus]
GYTPYDYEIATTTLVTTLLKQKGYDATMQQLDVGIMWSAISSGKLDATVTVELPVTHKLYAKKYKGKYVEVRKNLEHAKTGLAVPKYMKNINTIDDLKNK